MDINTVCMGTILHTLLGMVSILIAHFYKGLLKCGFINISVADLQYCLKIVKQLHDCTVETFGFPTHFNVKVLI